MFFKYSFCILDSIKFEFPSIQKGHLNKKVVTFYYYDEALKTFVAWLSRRVIGNKRNWRNFSRVPFDTQKLVLRVFFFYFKAQREDGEKNVWVLCLERKFGKIIVGRSPWRARSDVHRFFGEVWGTMGSPTCLVSANFSSQTVQAKKCRIFVSSYAFFCYHFWDTK